jgi:2'-5' RNA ligase
LAEIKTMAETVGVLSIFEGDLAQEGWRLWKLFENRYASKGVQSFDYPNVTFQGGTCHAIAPVESALVDLSRSLHPFTVTIDGLDYFDGPAKAVFLNVEISDELKQLNRTFNAMLSKLCESVFEHYRPEKWRPHVTVAMSDLTDDNFARAWHDLRDYHPHYQQIVSNICLVYVNQATGHIEIVRREPLT